MTTPAISRMSQAERRIFIEALAAVALRAALEQVSAEQTTALPASREQGAAA